MVEPVWIEASQLPNSEPLMAGYQRTWMKCPQCGVLQYYDFVPYSLSNPILTAACGHNQFGRKLHEYMIPVKVIGTDKPPVRTPVQSFRDDADHNYLDHLEHSGEIDMEDDRREETKVRFPTVASCLTQGVVQSGEQDMEEATGIALVRGILCAVENAVSECFEKAELYAIEELSSTEYTDEEIDHNGTIKGTVILEYTDHQRFVISIALPMDDYNNDEKLDSFIKHFLPGEKEFEIEQYELHVTKYRVKATTRAEAIAAVIKGDVSDAHNVGSEYVQVLYEQGMNSSTFEPHEVRDIERRAGVQVIPGQIDSIRSVKNV